MNETMPVAVSLYEILVPATKNGKKIKKKVHRIWDQKVSEIAGGLTVFKTKKGRWIHQGVMYAEKMIRVRVACDYLQIIQIVRFTKEFYEQEAVMYTLRPEKPMII